MEKIQQSSAKRSMHELFSKVDAMTVCQTERITISSICSVVLCLYVDITTLWAILSNIDIMIHELNWGIVLVPASVVLAPCNACIKHKKLTTPQHFNIPHYIISEWLIRQYSNIYAWSPFWQKLNDIRACISVHIHNALRDIITQPCSCINGYLAKPLLKYGHGWVICMPLSLWM